MTSKETKREQELDPQRELNKVLAKLKDLASKVYMDVVDNPKNELNNKHESAKSRHRYTFIVEGCTVAQCTKRLFKHFLDKNDTAEGIAEIQKVSDDIDYDTKQGFYWLAD